MKIVLASGNSHKLLEFKELLADAPCEIIGHQRKLEVEEGKQSFFENALLKAKAYSQDSGQACLSDDSGLSVTSLPGELGVESARFGGEELSDLERCELLLEKLKGVEDRSAYFVCVLCLYLTPSEIFYFEGRVSGSIAHEIKGMEGFGYDPLFIPEKLEGNSTFAQAKDWKSKNSHRAVACKYLAEFLKNFQPN